jgi:hypothetical protein
MRIATLEEKKKTGVFFTSCRWFDINIGTENDREKEEKEKNNDDDHEMRECKSESGTGDEPSSERKGEK